MDKIALGLANTVDYEIIWNEALIQRLVEQTGLCACEIEEKQQICSLKDLMASILYHMQSGSGCGMMVEAPEIIEAFLPGMEYAIALGGTNIRAAEVVSKLGDAALVHLVSHNPQTLQNLAPGVDWVGGEKYPCCYPHIAIQYPKGARIRANDIDITAPRPNRVIYSGDVACRQLEITPEFFHRAAKSRILVLSSFDLITDRAVLEERLAAVRREMENMPADGPLVFYEHACFADERFGDRVRAELGAFMDVYSMNEDEFQALTGRRIDLLDEQAVWQALQLAAERLPRCTILVHSYCWALLYGPRAPECLSAMETGMAVASTRYRCGDVNPQLLAETRLLPRQSLAQAFAGRLEALGNQIRCLPTAETRAERVTTVGLGDSFVGGFAFAYTQAHDQMKEV